MLTRSPTSVAAVARGCPSKAPAGLDAYLAASNGVGSLLALSMADEVEGGDVAISMGVVAAGMAVLHGASASWGFKEVRRCRNARSAMREAIVYPVYPAAYDGPPGAMGVPPDDVDVDVEIIPNEHPITIDEETETIETRTRTTRRIRVD
jgi:hypothetical protein